MLSTRTPSGSKQAKVVEAISKMATQLGPGAKLPTFQELSQSHGVSKVTLSLCLQQLEDAGIIIRHSRSGMYVSDWIFQKNIGLVFGKNIFAPGVSPFYSQLIRHCSERAQLGREHFSFYIDINPSSGTQVPGQNTAFHRDLTAALASGKLHGLIFTGYYDDAHEIWLRESGVPMVTTHYPSRYPGRSCPDYELLIQKGVQVLVSRGCQHLGAVGLEKHYMPGFEKTLLNMGLPVEKSWTVEVNRQQNLFTDYVKAGYEAVQDMLQDAVGRNATKARPEGLIIMDDMMAVGACVALQQAGIEVGKDIRVASHANVGSPTLNEWEDVIIRLEVNPEEMVENLFLMLETLMAGLPLPTAAMLVQPRVRIGAQC